ncbi:GNAT family N-acetyltransferase [Roseovarius sp. S4756]|uniref:GNAT family N-acetyltransferase n=1 Tax=Roseovarius maritimus TaxID=3342637 RepID=UPI00372CB69C
MGEIAMAPVMPDQIDMLDSALRQLAFELGDPYTADPAALAEAVCGPTASCIALLAIQGAKPVAAVLAAPAFSTSQGGAGIFVSDLWVAESARGLGLARQLLAATIREGRSRNAGKFLKLTVYHDSLGARAAYDRLGFIASTDETNMILTGAALEALTERAWSQL